MAITTIAELFEAGADFEVESWLSGNVTTERTLEGLLRRALGPEYDVSPATLSAFESLVREGMDVGRIVNEGGTVPIPAIPLRPGASGPGSILHRGYAVIDSDETDEGELPPSQHVPFAIQADDILTPWQIASQLREGTLLPIAQFATDSPRLQKRLEQLELDRMAGINQDWQAIIVSIFRIR